MKKNIRNILKDYKNILQMHGFYVDEDYKIISFDLIFSFDEETPEKCVNEITNKLNKEYPTYKINIILDADISD